jgi:hypothetical protein
MAVEIYKGLFQTRAAAMGNAVIKSGILYTGGFSNLDWGGGNHGQRDTLSFLKGGQRV